GDLDRLAVPSLLDLEAAVLGARELEPPLAREQEGREVRDLLPRGVVRGLLDELLEEVLHRVDVLEPFLLALGHPRLPEREELGPSLRLRGRSHGRFGLASGPLGPAWKADVAALEPAVTRDDARRLVPFCPR